MSSAKDKLIMMYMNECMERFSGEDLKFLKEKFWMVSYNFSVEQITSTELTTTNGNTTELLFDYFRIGKMSSNKSDFTIDQYRRVVNQLCDFTHKELNMITSDDVLSFLAKYKKYIMSKIQLWIARGNTYLLFLVIFLNTKRFQRILWQ